MRCSLVILQVNIFVALQLQQTRSKVHADTAMTGASLISLPREMLQHIAEQITHLRDVASLLRAHRRLHDVLRPSLYRRDAKSRMPRALVRGAHCDEMKTVKWALEAGSDIEAVYGGSSRPNDNEMDAETTPLLAAARNANLEMVRFLADAGADGRRIDSKGFNALIHAAQKALQPEDEGKRQALVGFLLERFPSLVYDITRGGGGLPAVQVAEQKAFFRMILETMDPIMCGSSLERAAVLGYEDIFHWLLERGVKVDLERWEHKNVNLLSNVCKGTSHAHVRIARFLIEQGANVEGTWFRSETTPLWNACKANGENVFDMVNMLLDNGAKVISEQNNRNRKFPLREACKNNNVALAELLVARNVTDQRYSANDVGFLLYAACYRGGTEVYRFITRNLPTPSLESPLGASLVSAACSSPSGNTALVKMLLDSGAPLPSTDLQYQVAPALVNAWKSGNIANLKLLLEAGADPNFLSTRSIPLIVRPDWPQVDDESQVACLKLVLSFGADPLTTVHKQFTPLHAACEAGAVGCVRLLLEQHGADPTARDENQLTPLHAAVRLLLQQHRGDPTARDEDQPTPLRASVQASQLEIVKILVAHGADVFAQYGTPPVRTALHDALQSGDAEEMIEYLLEKGTPSGSFGFQETYENDPARTGDAPLCILVDNLSLYEPSQAVEWLLDLDPEPCIVDRALTMACEKGFSATVKMLLKRGANPNSRWFGMTPLSAAAPCSTNIVNLLISYGADVNTLDMDGHAPFFAALHLENLHSSSIATLRRLLSAGADPSTAWGDGMSAVAFFEGEQTQPAPRKKVLLKLADLLEKVVNVDVMELLLDECGLQAALTPAEWSAIFQEGLLYGNGNLVRFLVDRGLVDIEKPDENGNTPEMLCTGRWYWGEVRDTIRHLVAQSRQREAMRA